MLHDSIRKLIALLKEQDVDEIEVRRFFTTIRVVRRRLSSLGHAGTAPLPQELGAPWPAAEAAAEDPASETEAAPAARVVVPSGAAGALREITSPMVGTFYRAREPQAEPLVHEGKRVKVGDVLCIIEAMKLMNEIESESNGVIQKILVENARPVEFGQPLFLIESA